MVNELFIMKKLLLICLILSHIPIWAQSVFVGTVLDSETKSPISSVNIQVGEKDEVITTNSEGVFRVKLNHEKMVLITISHVGYSTLLEKVTPGNHPNGKTFYLVSKSVELGSVEVSAIRADEKTPIAFTNIDKAELKALNTGQDIPFVLQNSPSVVASSDAGAGIGYTGMRIRGSDQTRINVTVNGVPINDAESHGVFWVNMPDLTSSLNSVQIQRGVGTSTNGAGAFGASVNMETSSYEKEGYGEVSVTGGSYNTQRYSVGFGTGLLNKHWVLQGRASMVKSDGWVDRSWSDMKSYYLTGGYFGEDFSLKMVAFGGREKTYQAWNGIDSSTYKMNPTFNSAGALYDSTGLTGYYDNETDNYGQDHYQLIYQQNLSKSMNLNVTGFYTRGKGFYEQYRQDDDFSSYGLSPIYIGSDTITSTDLIRRLWLDNHNYGVTGNITLSKEKYDLVIGGALSQYKGDHFGDLQWARFASQTELRDSFYFNQSNKIDYNVFAKINYDLTSKLSGFLDLQVRGVQYSGEGYDRDSAQIDFDDNFLFFNPKIGLNYAISNNQRAFVSFAMANKEPNRSDYTDAPNGDKPQHETLLDLELGYQSSGKTLSYEVNVFSMMYQNQLVLTGAINDVGAAIRDNVGSSYRVGVELAGSIKVTEWFNVNPAITYSQSRNVDSRLESNGTLINYGSTRISFSPDVIANAVLEFKPFNEVRVQWIPRFVSKQYLTNFGDPSNPNDFENLKLPSYFVNDVRVEYTPTIPTLSSSRFYVQVNNVLSEEYASNGYSYEWGGDYYMGFYPQAPINLLLGFSVRF